MVLIKSKPFRWNFVKTLAIYASADRLSIHSQTTYIESFRIVRVSCFNSFFRCAGKSYPPYPNKDTDTHVTYRHRYTKHSRFTEYFHWHRAKLYTHVTPFCMLCYMWIGTYTLILIRNYNVFLFCPSRMYTCVRFPIGVQLGECGQNCIIYNILYSIHM